MSTENKTFMMRCARWNNKIEIFVLKINSSKQISENNPKSMSCSLRGRMMDLWKLFLMKNWWKSRRF